MYENKCIQAIQKNEFILYLRGDYPYNIETSQYAPGKEPTDVGKVLSKAIYKIYKNNPLIKEEFERTLVLILDGTLFDVYVVLLYVISQLFKEKNDLSPFIADFGEVIPKLKQQLNIRKEEFQKGLIYPDGFEKKNVWDEIERLNRVCIEQYETSLL